MKLQHIKRGLAGLLSLAMVMGSVPVYALEEEPALEEVSEEAAEETGGAAEDIVIMGDEDEAAPVQEDIEAEPEESFEEALSEEDDDIGTALIKGEAPVKIAQDPVPATGVPVFPDSFKKNSSFMKDHVYNGGEFDLTKKFTITDVNNVPGVEKGKSFSSNITVKRESKDSTFSVSVAYDLSKNAYLAGQIRNGKQITANHSGTYIVDYHDTLLRHNDVRYSAVCSGWNGTGWVMTGSLDGKYDDQPQSVLNYYQISNGNLGMTYKMYADCYCGNGSLSNHQIFLTENKAPTITKVYHCMGKENPDNNNGYGYGSGDSEGYIALEFSEDVRLANPGDESEVSLYLEQKDKTTDRAPDEQIVATLVYLKGNKAIFSFPTPETLDGKSNDLVITGIKTSQESLMEESGLKIYNGDGRPVSGDYKAGSRITDIAGNTLDFKNSTKALTSPIYIDMGKPRVTKILLGGTVLDQDASNVTGYIKEGDEITLRVVYSEQLDFNERWTGFAQNMVAKTTIRRDGSYLTVKGKQFSNISAKQINSVDSADRIVTVLDFEPIKIKAGDQLGANFRIDEFRWNYMGWLTDLTGNVLFSPNGYSGNSVLPDIQVMIDADAPAIAVEDDSTSTQVGKDDDDYYYDKSAEPTTSGYKGTNYFTIPIKITDKKSGVKGKYAKIELEVEGLSESSVIDYYVDTAYETDYKKFKSYFIYANGKTYFSIPLTGNIYYLHFALLRNTEYGVPKARKAEFKAALNITASDRAGNEAKKTIKIKHNADSEAPRISQIKATQNYTGQHLIWEGYVTDDHGVAAVHYKWNDGEWRLVNSSTGHYTIDDDVSAVGSSLIGTSILYIRASDYNDNETTYKVKYVYDFVKQTTSYTYENGGSLTQPVLYPTLSVTGIGKVGTASYHTYVLIPTGDGDYENLSGSYYVTGEGEVLKSGWNSSIHWYTATGGFVQDKEDQIALKVKSSVDNATVKAYFDEACKEQEILLLTVYNDGTDNNNNTTLATLGELDIPSDYAGYQSIEHLKAFLMGNRDVVTATIGNPIDLTKEGTPEVENFYCSEDGWDGTAIAAAAMTDYAFPININGSLATDVYGTGILKLDDTYLKLEKYDGSDWTTVRSYDISTLKPYELAFTEDEANDYPAGLYRINLKITPQVGKTIEIKRAFCLETERARLDAALTSYDRVCTLEKEGIRGYDRSYKVDEVAGINSGDEVLYVGEGEDDAYVTDKTNELSFSVSMKTGAPVAAGVTDKVKFRVACEGDEEAPWIDYAADGTVKYELKLVAPGAPYSSVRSEGKNILSLEEGYNTVLVQSMNNAGIIDTIRTLHIKAHKRTPKISLKMDYTVDPDNPIRLTDAKLTPVVSVEDVESISENGVIYFDSKAYNYVPQKLENEDEDEDYSYVIKSSFTNSGYYYVMDAYGNVGADYFYANGLDNEGPGFIEFGPGLPSTNFSSSYDPTTDRNANPMGFHLAMYYSNEAHPDPSGFYVTFDEAYSELLTGKAGEKLTVKIPIGDPKLDDDGNQVVENGKEIYESWYDYTGSNYGIYHTEATRENGFATIEIWGVFKYDKTKKDQEVTRTLTFSCEDSYGNKNYCDDKVLSFVRTNTEPSLYAGKKDFYDSYTSVYAYGGFNDESVGTLNEINVPYVTGATGEGANMGLYALKSIKGCGAEGVRYSAPIDDGSYFWNCGITPCYTTLYDVHEDGEYELTITDMFGQTFEKKVNIDCYAKQKIAVELNTYDYSNEGVDVTVRSNTSYNLSSVRAVDLRTESRTLFEKENVGAKELSFSLSENAIITAVLDNYDQTTREVKVINMDNVLEPCEVIYYREDGGSLEDLEEGEACPCPITAAISCNEEVFPITEHDSVVHTFGLGSRKGDTFTFNIMDEARNKGKLVAECPFDIGEPASDEKEEVNDLNASFTPLAKRFSVYKPIGKTVSGDAADILEALNSAFEGQKAQGYAIEIKTGDDVRFAALRHNDRKPAYADCPVATAGGVKVSAGGVTIASTALLDLYLVNKDGVELRISGIKPGTIDTTAPSANVVYKEKAEDAAGPYIEAVILPVGDEPLTFEVNAVSSLDEGYSDKGAVYENAYSMMLRRNGSADYYFLDEVGNRGGVRVETKDLTDGVYKKIDARILSTLWFGTDGNKSPDKSYMVSNDVSRVINLTRSISDVVLYKEGDDGRKIVVVSDNRISPDIKGSTFTLTWHENTEALGTDIYVLGEPEPIEVGPVEMNIIDKVAPSVSNVSHVLADNKKSVTITFDTDEGASVREAVRRYAGNILYDKKHTVRLVTKDVTTLHITDKTGNATELDISDIVDGLDLTSMNVRFSLSGAGEGVEASSLGEMDKGDTYYVKTDKAAKISAPGTEETEVAPGVWTEFKAGEDRFNVVKATDVNTGEEKYYTLLVRPDDVTPPVIIFGQSMIVVKDDITMERLKEVLLADVKVKDDRDGEIDRSKTTMGNLPDEIKVGSRQISYTVSDAAGNTSVQRRTLQIISADSLIASVRSLVALPGVVMSVSGQKQELHIDNPAEGSIVARIGRGIKTGAQMKYEPMVDTDGGTDFAISTPEEGFYTVLVRNQNREQVVFYLYRD